ncbi:MAG: hypothetical protein AAF907_02425, partial [Planctomycetota bacterium]
MRFSTLGLCLPALLCLGCGEPQPYRAETQLNADGTVTRTVQQHDLQETEDEWTGVRPARQTAAEDWQAPLSDIPTDEKGATRIAWGEFLSPAHLPQHVRGTASEPARLSRDPAITKYGLLTVYEWRETVRPAADMTRSDSARGELFAELAAHCEAVLNEGLPEGTNVAPLIGYLRTTGDALSADLFWAVQRGLIGDLGPRSESAEPSDRPEEESGTQWLRPAAEVLRSFGLNLFRPDDSMVDSDVGLERFREFAREQIGNRVLNEDGTPLDDAGYERLCRLLDLDSFL